MIPLLALFLGCTGQSLFYGRGGTSMSWAVPGVFLLPWLIIFVINFTKASLVSHDTHRRIVVGAIVWWAAVTVVTELLLLGGVIEPLPRPQMIAAQLLMNVGWLGVVPVVRTIRE